MSSLDEGRIKNRSPLCEVIITSFLPVRQRTFRPVSASKICCGQAVFGELTALFATGHIRGLNFVAVTDNHFATILGGGILLRAIAER
jgi:hypothetical protein